MQTMKTENPLYGQDILSADQFDVNTLIMLNMLAEQMKSLVATEGKTDVLRGKAMTPLFYEDSSRTKGSFVMAMQRLGGMIGSFERQFSSVNKGENLEDTVRTFEGYSDVIVLRHPDEGSAHLAASYLQIPLINAGDGVGEHPTQALLDQFTVADHFQEMRDLRVTMVGDLKHGRTIHSFSRLLSLFPNIKINLVSPDELKLPEKLYQELGAKGVHLYETGDLGEVISESDVLYMTRVQKERFSDPLHYERLKHHYIVTPELMKRLPKDSILMHPLPRVGEIDPEVDDDPRAIYLRKQVPNGMFMRMAVLYSLLDKDATL